MLDGEYYVRWARSLASGAAWRGGAFYMAPLYPYLLSGFFRVFGENFVIVYAFQQACVVGAAGTLAVAVRRAHGGAAALFCAAAVLTYHPLLYFASRPLGEPVAILLLAAAVLAGVRTTPRAGAVAGVLAGVSSLARPNLLLVPLVWAGHAALRRRWAAALATVLGVLAAVAPVMVRNFVASGHAVPVSADSGIVFYLGNAPEALGTLSAAPGFTGRVSTQQDEATALARSRSGRDLDSVEADRWWGREGLRARLEDPRGRFVCWAGA